MLSQMLVHGTVQPGEYITILHVLWYV